MPSQFGSLALDDSPRTGVFRAVDAIIRTDPNLRRLVKTWSSFRGENIDTTDLVIGHAPAIRISPMPTSEAYWYPGATKGSLCINVEMLVKGTCVDDAENLWYALSRALVPRDQQPMLAVHKKLTDAGAMTGIVTPSQPAFDPNPGGESGTLRAFGQFTIEVKTS